MVRGIRISHTHTHTLIAPFGGRIFLLVLLLARGMPAMAGEVTDWVLRGTLILGGQSGYAIVEQSVSREQSWYRTDTEILPGMRLVDVFSDHAIVIYKGKQKRVDFGTRLTALPVTASYHINPLRFAEIAGMVDIIPQQQDGRVVGYYANGIPETLRSEIGLQPGDLVRRINGMPLDDKFDPSYFYEMLQSGRLNVDVTRAGQPVQLVYQVGR